MSYELIKILIFILTFFLSSTIFARAQNAPGSKPATILFAAKNIDGAWKLNAGESDDATAKIDLMMATKTRQPGQLKVEADETPSISISLFHPDSVVLAAEGDSSMTINQMYSDFIQTRTVIADGVTRFYEITLGAMCSVTADKRPGNLKIETVSPRGNKMIENYSLLSAVKLSVTMRIENSQAQELITMRRVYDRSVLGIFAGGDEENIQ